MARILCVDDEPHVVTLKCAILEAAGHEATPSTSARDAIEKLKHNHYDAIVTDWRLGDASGRAIVQAAKITLPCRWWWFPDTLQRPFRPQNRSPIYIWRSR